MKQKNNILSLGFLMLSGNLYAAAPKASDPGGKIKSDQITTIPAVPVLVGYSVYSQVDDLHKSVSNLVDAISAASDSFGYADTKEQQTSLRRMKERLNEIEGRLKHKADISDEKDWYGFFNKPQFSVTVHEAIRDLGLILNSIAHGMEGGSRTAPKIPYRVANDTVDKVSDLRKEISELMSALNSSKKWPPFSGAMQNAKQVDEYMRRLQEIDIALDRKDEITDEAWLGWFRGPAYKVTVHDAIADMGGILNGISASLSGRSPKI